MFGRFEDYRPLKYPKGIDFLFIRKGIELPPYADSGAQEFGKRAGTENVASIVGMAVALKANCDIFHENEAHLRVKDCCYVQFRVINDLLERGQAEGLLSFLLDVRYLYEEH